MKHSKYTFLQYLFDNIPEYKQYWLVNDFKRWQRAPELRTLGIAVATLLWFTEDELKQGRNKHLKFIFDLIENMLNSDNEDAQYAAYMMFLESLYFRNDEIPYNLYSKFLGHKSKEAMREIEQS